MPKAFGAAPFFPDILVPFLILIDYLELPVIGDLLHRTFRGRRR